MNLSLIRTIYMKNENDIEEEEYYFTAIYHKNKMLLLPQVYSIFITMLWTLKFELNLLKIFCRYLQLVFWNSDASYL